MDILITMLVGLLLLVGAVGTILPVLPGSILVLAGLLIWAIAIGGPAGWLVFAFGALACLVGMTASALLTGRRLTQRAIPNRSILIGVAVGVLGALLIPVVGLFLGFIAGLFASEYQRLRDPRRAWQASVAALQSIGMGMLVEFGCTGLAVAVWLIGVFHHF